MYYKAQSIFQRGRCKLAALASCFDYPVYFKMVLIVISQVTKSRKITGSIYPGEHHLKMDPPSAGDLL